MTELEIRKALVSCMASFIGVNEADGSHMSVINMYNDHVPLARNYKVKSTDAWCATGASAAAIKAGLTDIIPTECSCQKQIDLWIKMGRWQEDGKYVPKMGDYIYYNWDDSTQPNDGNADHVGIVEVDSNGNTVKVIECNKNDRCERRTIIVGWGYIRGYGLPDYASKATVDFEENTEETKDDTKEGASGLSKIPKYIGKVTASVLNVRSWAGMNYSKIKAWPTLQKGNKIEVCDEMMNGDTTWLYIRIDGRIYGFVSAAYVEKVDKTMSIPSTIPVGTIVEFTGNTHFASSYAKATPVSCKPGKAKVTAMNLNSAHQYHLVAEKDSGSTVYGWVNREDILG